ncbi:hypothetical protein KCP78_09900 [Salmonella enterica subsp. enterica]|nr:hypothetical protein KCP78_09900 [Salmonella enterica subsp. enterica]
MIPIRRCQAERGIEEFQRQKRLNARRCSRVENQRMDVTFVQYPQHNAVTVAIAATIKISCEFMVCWNTCAVPKTAAYRRGIAASWCD